MDKFVIKIPKTSTEPTPSSSETTVSTSEDSSSRPKDVGQKKELFKLAGKANMHG